MIIKKQFLLILLFLMAPNSYSRALLISDIDDTLKMSHTAHPLNFAINANKTDLYFKGMSELYDSLRQRDPDIFYFYLSNAPASLFGLYHQELLDRSQAPDGPLLLRTTSGSDHKIGHIRTLLNEYQPDTVFLLGDHAQYDSLIYLQAQKEYPNILFHTYIRQLYQAKQDHIENNQHPFVSAFDLITLFYQHNHLTFKEANKLFKHLAPDFLDEINSTKATQVDNRPLFLAPWGQCQGHQFEPSFFWILYPEIKAVLENYCS